jgi:Fe-S oxidoreductase/FAD/FMN-containing dehydrogenase
MDKSLENELIGIFGENVAFHNLECQLYSSDSGALPGLFKASLQIVPRAVVQPIDKDQLVRLIAVAVEYHLPLTPRGASTAGYGGAVPTKSGIVVDFSRMCSVIKVDESSGNVTVEPGITLQALDNYLQDHNLALQSYPSSAISATAGGWLAAGLGAGIGSYQFGYFPDAISSIELIAPDGVHNLKGEEIKLVAGLSGTTGFISKMTLKTQKRARLDKLAIAFNSIESFFNLIQSAIKIGLPLWHVGYYNNRQLQVSQRAVNSQIARDEVHHDKMHDLSLLGENEKLCGLFAVAPDNIKRLIELTGKSGPRLLDQTVSEYLWQERYYPMRQKALGPSIIPGEVILPFHELSKMVTKVEQKFPDTFSLEGTLINGGKEASALFIFLDDERRFGYELSYEKSMFILSEAKRLGGRTYGIGMLLTQEAVSLWGQDNLNQIFNFKKKVDPDNILNPGKIFPSSIAKDSPVKYLELLTGLANVFQPVLGSVDKALQKLTYKPITVGYAIRKKIPPHDVGWDILACTGCGYCRTICTEFNVFKWESTSPRGKFNYLKQNLKDKQKLDQRMADAFFMCATCRRCDNICQARIPILQHWDLSIRPMLRDQNYVLPSFHRDTTINVLKEHNPIGYPHERRTDFLTPDISFQESGEVGYWVGCTASYSMRQLAENPLRILNAAGISPVLFKDDEWCCGSDILLYGQIDEISDTIKHNIEAIQRRGIKKLITHCPGCWAAFSLYYPILAKKLGLDWNIQIEHITETLENLIVSNKMALKNPVNLKVSWHDPCHIGRRGGIYDAPRAVLNKIPGIELLEMPQIRENSLCCGRQLFQYTAQGPKPYVDRVIEAYNTGAAALITSCPGCQATFILGAQQTGIAQFECLDITDLVCLSLGIPVKSYKLISRMIRHGYDSGIKPKVDEDCERSADLFIPHKQKSDLLAQKREE